MCDTVVVVGPDAVRFAKNSDRDPNEAQFLDWQPRRSWADGESLRCTWIEIPQARETWAVLLSRPFWMWGAEIGANEHGVVIGNEAVFTREPYAPTGLLGMDLLRLALERCASAPDAVEKMVEWLERYGQGGGCGHEDRGFTYHNSFIVADAHGAFVLETAGAKWETERVEGARSISNGLTIPGFAQRHSDRIRTRVASAKARRHRTQTCAERVTSTADLMALLRDHGEGCAWPSYSHANGAMSAPCVHAGGVVAASQTTASWIAELRADAASHWATGTAAPCIGLFKPVEVSSPVDLGTVPGDQADDSLWWRHEELHRRVMRDPERHAQAFLAERDALESRWLAAPPPSAMAFKEGDAALTRWLDATGSVDPIDRRPAWTRRYWSKRNERAGI